MFSGIVAEVGQIASLERGERSSRLLVRGKLFAGSSVLPGESIAVNGVCLTVVSIADGAASFDISSETLRCTTFTAAPEGAAVNLERALVFGERVGGHLVSGHVDSVAEIVDVRPEGETTRYELSFPGQLRAYLAEKGSVAVDGTSLTVGEVSADRFSVYVIPFTITNTICRTYRAGTRVNLEVDYLARYVVSALSIAGSKRGDATS